MEVDKIIERLLKRAADLDYRATAPHSHYPDPNAELMRGAAMACREVAAALERDRQK